MTSPSCPPGLVSAACKRNHRRQQAAIKHALLEEYQTRLQHVEDRVQALEFSNGYALSVDVSHHHDSTIASRSSLEHSDSIDSGESLCEQFYIGESTASIAIQTDLTVNPGDGLAYSMDPVMLIHAGVNNALLDLQMGVKEGIREADMLLKSSATASCQDDCWSFAFGACDDSAQEFDTQAVEHEVRLCSLRLQKVQKQWDVLCDEINMELAASCCSVDDYTLFLEDSLTFCEDLDAILQAQQTVGAWSNGQAVFAILMGRFGYQEGPDAVEEYMKVLGIVPDETSKPIMSLALSMLINDRCDDINSGFDRL